jgi:sulfonate transport system substrate-binding protein
VSRTKTMLGRRTLLGAAGAGLVASTIRPARAAGVLRVGDQNAGVRSLVEAAGTFEGFPYRFEWHQFPAAAPVLEAMNAGALDVGFTGDMPFLFAFAAGAPIRAVGGSRANGRSQAIVVPAGSPVRSMQDLRGKRVAANRGGNGHFLMLAALERAGMQPGDVNFKFMLPPEARAAFAGGSVDAWAVWEPYVSIVVLNENARTIETGEGIFPSKTFQLAHLDAIRDQHPAITDFTRRVAQARLWALTHPEEISVIVAKLTGQSLPVARRSIDIARNEPIQIDAAVVAETQAQADLFTRHGVLPARIDMSAALNTSFSDAG